VWVVGLPYSVVSVGNVRAPSRNERGAPSIRRRTQLLLNVRTGLEPAGTSFHTT